MKKHESQRATAGEFAAFDGAIGRMVRIPKAEMDRRLEADKKAREKKRKAS